MEDVDLEEMPGAIVEAFLEREEGVRRCSRNWRSSLSRASRGRPRPCSNLADSDESVSYDRGVPSRLSEFFGDGDGEFVTARTARRRSPTTFPDWSSRPISFGRSDRTTGSIR